MATFDRRTALRFIMAAPAIASESLRAEDAWPTKPVQIIMGFGAGGGADTMARILFQRVSEILKRPFIISNRTGGNSVVAAQAVLDARRDGYTFLVNGLQQLVNPVLIPDVVVDYPSFQPVSKLCNYPQALSVATDAPWRTLSDFVADAKARPGKIRYGTSGIGGIPHLIGELLQIHAGIKLLNVPYRIAPEMTRDLVGGQLEMTILTISTSQPVLQSGQARVLAIGSAARAKILPDVPTLAEAGLPGANQSDWSGLFAAPGVPESIQIRMQQAIAEAARDPAVREKLEQQGTEIVGDRPDTFRPFVVQQRELFTGVIKTANIKAE